MALLTVQEFLEMAAFIDRKMNLRQGRDGHDTWDCDGTLRHTTAWLEAHGKSLEDNLEEIGDQGGYCDCEVLLNVRTWPQSSDPDGPRHHFWEDDEEE
jgi:hypothetical protein